MGTSIITSFNNPELRKLIKGYLVKMGEMNINEAENPENLLRLVTKQKPKLVIYDPNSFGAKGLQVGKTIAREKVSPILFIVSNPIHRPMVEEIIHKSPYATTYLLTPITQELFRIAVSTTLISFKKITELENKIITLNEKIQEKKKIAQAKELLIRANNWTEPQAHRFLQKRSMDTAQPLKVVAMKILQEFGY